ncbi:MAG: chromate transporter [Burkholderiales bacterium RIFCSPHIGHO2_01_FULL_64_960]|nr:MAG: chromate transporter [Burkholderiales bacterium RIFCSPHIGHO2_01_FULL_64_960]OGB06646.1 MAG: chromate transporter [Burkholderiales bacterium RIFCSPHIGHO2_02_FULL_64_19]OGB16006.1 MAG: chromate transporter [Burkholderiales bacterium RIFCSPHIGHO2_12_FULL_65_48]OGB54276.1 MAG: chromate transporter [Burkholderiales bacterium RIFCSPLOWO2_12_FULL_64_33]
MPLDTPKSADPTRNLAQQGSSLEVFLAFLKLGLTSFGGPVAHLGYFRTEFVERRKWLDDKSYSDLVALCQFLPGPASSQVGIALGLGRAGWWGALCAWMGFTLPSAIALILFAFGVTQWAALAQSGAVHGLKVVAVAIVAQAVWGMAKNLCPDRLRAGIAIVAALVVLAIPSAMGQIGAIVAGGLVGRWAVQLGHLPAAEHRNYGVSKKVGAALLILFGILLVVLPVLASTAGSPTLSVISSFYQSGALVFGGGHVVLPLLQAGVVPSGLVTNDAFLAGYGAAQAVPGPLFTFAAYLGAVMTGELGGWMGGLVLLLTIFVPAFLLVVGALPFWEPLRQRDGIQRAMAGVNAAVVGVLAAALYDPVWTSAIHSRADFGLALAAFGLLVYGRQSPVLVVALAAVAGWLLAV